MVQNYRHARKLYEKAAAQGNDLAQYQLGVLYSFGYGIKQDTRKAKTVHSTKSVLSISIVLISRLFKPLFGYGVKLNYAKAKAWYEKAAALDHAEAQYNLGFMYVEGLGIKHDLNKAKELMAASCENGLEKGCEASASLKHNQRLLHTHHTLLR